VVICPTISQMQDRESSPVKHQSVLQLCYAANNVARLLSIVSDEVIEVSRKQNTAVKVKTDICIAPRCGLHSFQTANTPHLPLPTAFHQRAPLLCVVIDYSLLLIYRPREDERLSWPSWLGGSVVERQSLIGKLSLVCTGPAADW